MTTAVAVMRAALASALLWLAGPLAAQEAAYARFGEFVAQFRQDSGTPSLSAVIVKDGAIVWEGYYGSYDDEGEWPTGAQTTYKIASLTKPIAAAALLAEAAAGGLDLSTPMTADGRWAVLCRYFVSTPIPYMSGGVDHHGNEIAPMQCDKATTLAQMLDMRANGDSFVYNPIAYARIDRAVSGAGGRDLRDIVRQRVARVAGMDDTALGWRDPLGGAALRHLAEPFHVVEGRAVKQPLPDDDFRAAAGIITNPRAIAAFDIALDAQTFYATAELAKRPIGPLGDYRAGWWLEDWQGQRLIWHSGWNEKQYSALYLKLPSKRLSLIVLANTESLWWGNSLVKAEISQSPVARRFLQSFGQ